MAEDTKQLGVYFTWIGWLIGIVLLVLIFNKLLDVRDSPISSIQNGDNPYTQIILKSNYQGHYIFNGYINQKKVKFLVDTGATFTSIPANLAQNLGLSKGQSYRVNTANGMTTAYDTEINNLQLGEIRLHNIQASIVPGMQGNEALLGMNVLKHFELIQREKQLIIRAYH